MAKKKSPSTPSQPNSANSSASNRRITVLLGTVKKKVKGTEQSVKIYSFMKKATADYFGYTGVTTVPRSTPSSSGGSNNAKPKRLLRGSLRAGSIKLIGTDGKSKSIPIPAGISVDDTEKFVRKATKNKPVGFVTKDGKYIPLPDTK